MPSMSVSPPLLQTLCVLLVPSDEVVLRSWAVHQGSLREEKQTVHFYLSVLLGGTAQASGREASSPERT